VPDLGPLHPQVVHFVIALGLVGVLLRLLSLVISRWSAWLSPAATTLILVAAGASVVAVTSGLDTHENSERIPGARVAVQTHELWGKRTRNVLLGVAALELLALAFGSKRAGRPLRYVAAAGGVVAGLCIFKVADLGGDIVYEYAGGIGTRSGDPGDIDRLLVAGLFYTARKDRDSGRAEDAARMVDELLRRNPADTAIRFLAIESKLRDRNDPVGALTDLAQFPIPPENRYATRHGLLTAQALVASGRVDSARVILTGLLQRFPQNQAVKAALDKLR
jgi:uncharacterized membrane protein